MGQSYVIDWTGKIFNNCQIVEPVIADKRTCDSKWKIICFCKKEFIARPSDLKRGKVPSCGCNRSKLARIQMQKIEYFNYTNDYGIKLLKPTNEKKTVSKGSSFQMNNFSSSSIEKGAGVTTSGTF